MSVNVEAVKIALQLLQRVDIKGTEAQAYIFVTTTFENYVNENSPDGDGAVTDANDQ